MMFSRRSEAESEVDHGVAERFLDLADLPGERRSRAGAHRHILAKGWNAVGREQLQQGRIFEERKELEAVETIRSHEQQDDDPRCADKQVHPHHGKGGGGGGWCLLLLCHKSKWNSQKRRPSDNSEKSNGLNNNINHNNNDNNNHSHLTTTNDQSSSSRTHGSQA